MPRPPHLDGLSDIGFVTNYFAQGCIPPFWLVVEYSREPVKDMFLLLIGFDLKDIVTDWLRPRNPRHNSPARHGKKKNPRGIPLDVNEIIGGRARESADGNGVYPGITLPGAKSLFMLGDKIDRLNFTAAVMEGVTDIGFETLWGIITNHPETCPTMGFIQRTAEPFEFILAIIQPYNPLNLTKLEAIQGFNSSGGFGCTNVHSDFTLTLSGIIKGWPPFGCENAKVQLRGPAGDIRAESGSYTLGPDETSSFSIEAEFAQNESASWTGSATFGTARLEPVTMCGWAGTWF